MKIVSASLITSLLLLILFCSCSPTQENRNILFFFSDDHTTQALSIYGDGRIETPYLDKLAQEGLVFDNCFCTNAICAPSRAVVLTGKYSHLNGLRDNSDIFDGSQETFPKLLRNAGYRTALIGKWHLKSEPTGFDYWKVLPGQGKYFDPEFIEMGETLVEDGYVTEIITEDVIRYLETYDYNQPFCLMVQHKAPHADWEWPEKYKNEFNEDFPVPETFSDSWGGRGGALLKSDLKVGENQWNIHYKYRFGAYPYASPEEMYQRYMHDYMRCIRAVDKSVGEILKAVERTGFDKNTVIIYSSDQGFFLGEHGLYDKRFMYEESLRMPLIISGTGMAGKRIENMVLNLDFGPTILELCGIKAPDAMQGLSFAPLLFGEEIPDWRKSVYYHFYEHGYGIGEHEGIRTYQYKLIHYYYPEEEWELYDLTKDPEEMENIFNLPEILNVQEDLIQSLDSIKKVYRVPTGLN